MSDVWSELPLIFSSALCVISLIRFGHLAIIAPIADVTWELLLYEFVISIFILVASLVTYWCNASSLKSRNATIDNNNIKISEQTQTIAAREADIVQLQKKYNTAVADIVENSKPIVDEYKAETMAIITVGNIQCETIITTLEATNNKLTTTIDDLNVITTKHNSTIVECNEQISFMNKELGHRNVKLSFECSQAQSSLDVSDLDRSHLLLQLLENENRVPSDSALMPANEEHQGDDDSAMFFVRHVHIDALTEDNYRLKQIEEHCAQFCEFVRDQQRLNKELYLRSDDATARARLAEQKNMDVLTARNRTLNDSVETEKSRNEYLSNRIAAKCRNYRDLLSMNKELSAENCQLRTGIIDSELDRVSKSLENAFKTAVHPVYDHLTITRTRTIYSDLLDRIAMIKEKNNRREIK
jgi:hypothetical protein